jgi:predicted XRE-type DNA-binding protein
LVALNSPDTDGIDDAIRADRASILRVNPDPISELKEQAARALVPLVEHWSRGDAAALIGIERERIAELCRGKLDRFSLERLIRLLVRAGAHVELRIAQPTVGPFAQRGR